MSVTVVDMKANWRVVHPFELECARGQIRALQERMQQSIIGQETVVERLVT